ncbi:hypothetical protein DFH09DRAFT_918508, partial [Mycena vulgaris]
ISAPPPCPPKAADWFVHARGQMTETYLGPHFNAVLTAWTRLEEVCRFEVPSHKLSSKAWPEQITCWINNARGRKGSNPIVKDPVAYATIWWTWWDSLQPEWRVRGLDGLWESGESYGGEWDDNLLHWGPNGTLSVVAGLFFWGCAVVMLVDRREEWELTVNDVAWILEGLATFHKKFKKRR